MKGLSHELWTQTICPALNHHIFEGNCDDLWLHFPLLLQPCLSLSLFLIYFPVYDGQLYEDRKTAGGFCLKGLAMVMCWPFLVHSLSLAHWKLTWLLLGRPIWLWSCSQISMPRLLQHPSFLSELPPSFCYAVLVTFLVHYILSNPGCHTVILDRFCISMDSLSANMDHF